MDTYDVLLVATGIAILGAAALPRLISRFPLSTPIVYVAFGMAVFALPVGLELPDPIVRAGLTESLSEMVVIVSLMGVGLQIDRPMGWRSWRLTWRLLAFAMPLMIALTAVIGWWAGLAPASALLLGAVLAPTDPVLATDVQVGSPGHGEEDEVRFALTSEAGLNDALAFPFTYAAVAVAVAAPSEGVGDWIGAWVLEDVLYRLGVGVAAGVSGGWFIGSILFGSRRLPGLAEGFVSLGITLLVYGGTELVHGYGFLAVFVAAITLRARERHHDLHREMHEFAEIGERLLSSLLLILLGGAVVGGVLGSLKWLDVGIAVALVLVARPLTAALSLLGARLPGRESGAIAFFGVRGMGSIYYLAFATTHATFPDIERVWAIATLTILGSVLIHGISATPIMSFLDRRHATPAKDEAPGAS